MELKPRRVVLPPAVAQARAARAKEAAALAQAVPLRGNAYITAAMEMLQTGYLFAVAAAAGCACAKPFPDIHGTDFNLSHGSDQHTMDPVAEIRVQLKSTYGIKPEKLRGKSTFAFQLENADLKKLAASPVTLTRLLVVLLLPSDQAEWLAANHDYLAMRHCAYWVNLEAVPPTGQTKTTVRVPVDNVFDDIALCEIMRKVGIGEKPQ